MTRAERAFIMALMAANTPERSVPATRRGRREDAMRAQYVRTARRSVYRTSGTPHMSRSRIASGDAAIYITGGAQ